MNNVLVSKYKLTPPAKPIDLNGILFNRWRNVETGEEVEWDEEKKEWIKKEETCTGRPD